MPNFRIFGNSTSQIITSPEIAAANGNVYIVSTGIQEIVKNTSDFLALYIENTSSDNFLSISHICSSAVIQTSFAIYRGGSAITGGDAANLQNANSTFGNPSEVTAQYIIQNTDPSTGRTYLYGFIQDSGVFMHHFNGSIKIGPSSSLTFVFQNVAASGTGQVSINVALIKS